jgi:hypothetical protein
MLREDDVRTGLALDRAAAWIRAQQRADGYLPWDQGGHADTWNMIEAAMGVDCVGSHATARSAYHWLASSQLPDGSWYAAYRHGAAEELSHDANFCAYIATGLWHNYLFTRDVPFLDEMWPALRRAIDFVLDMQLPTGEIMWARDQHGAPWPAALMTSSSCIALSLRCAIAIAELLDRDRPDWELSLTQLDTAVRSEQGTFLDKRRYSMDWYYPVLGGVLRGDAARDRITSRWGDFVIEGRGVRCVIERPWVTTGETCELVIACAIAGMRDEAEALFGWIQHLADDDGGYWTGATVPDGTVWPVEKTTWNGGAVLLAADCLQGGPTMSLFDHSSMLSASDRIPDAI